MVARGDRHLFFRVAGVDLILLWLADGAFAGQSLNVLLTPLLFLLELFRLLLDLLGPRLLGGFVLSLDLGDPAGLETLEIMHHARLLVLRQVLDLVRLNSELVQEFFEDLTRVGDLYVYFDSLLCLLRLILGDLAEAPLHLLLDFFTLLSLQLLFLLLLNFGLDQWVLTQLSKHLQLFFLGHLMRHLLDNGAVWRLLVARDSNVFFHVSDRLEV